MHVPSSPYLCLHGHGRACMILSTHAFSPSSSSCDYGVVFNTSLLINLAAITLFDARQGRRQCVIVVDLCTKCMSQPISRIDHRLDPSRRDDSKPKWVYALLCFLSGLALYAGHGRAYGDLSICRQEYKSRGTHKVLTHDSRYVVAVSTVGIHACS